MMVTAMRLGRPGLGVVSRRSAGGPPGQWGLGLCNAAASSDVDAPGWAERSR